MILGAQSSVLLAWVVCDIMLHSVNFATQYALVSHASDIAIHGSATYVAGIWNGNGPTDMWRLPYIVDVYSWCYKREMLLLSHSKPGTRIITIIMSLHFVFNSPNIAHVNCGNCHTTLMYPYYGAPSVKCAVCQYITNVNMGNVRVPIPMHRPNGPPSSAPTPSSSTSQTVVVENPMSVDKSGKLVSNVVVGVTTDKK
ncbi:protein LSD1 [Sesamum angolense]|uniref:Protein LSD1 n=1 Tax=Sesamum angolense TaxID=2727404 RepID=A0AAE1X3T9_9LAMI|nr:protein LSD1 [Sesamum angolense]